MGNPSSVEESPLHTRTLFYRSIEFKEVDLTHSMVLLHTQTHNSYITFTYPFFTHTHTRFVFYLYREQDLPT